MGRFSLHGWLVALLALVAAVGCSSPGRELLDRAASEPQAQPEPTSPPAAKVAPSFEYSVHLPPDAEARQPLTVLVALHGMGGNGADFSRRLIEDADRNGWLLVAPTLSYRDWRDPEQVRRDGSDLLPGLKAMLDELPARTGLAVRKRALLYGFSRGGQMAHRFALFFPRATRGVVALSTGTFTLPATRIRLGADETPLAFPYGVGDLEQIEGRPFDPTSLRQVDFWVGVGERDNQATELPHQWDPYIGTTRVERARSFARALAQLGTHAELTVFPGAAHEMTDDMRARAVAFLGSLAQ